MLYAVFAAGALSELSQVWSEIAAASGAAERLFEIMAVEPAIRRPAHPVALPEPPRGEIAFEDVHFAYPTRPETSALHGLSFTVRAGEKVAIVGPSGAGKSTIFHLILRFYDPTAGTVALDGVRLDAADPQDVRRRIALVPQDTAIFATSVRDNIRFGRPDATDAEIERAAEAAAAAEFIRRLPQGYDTRGRRARRHALGRPAPAHRDRARDPARCAAAAARRGDVIARCRERDPGADRR